MKKLSLLILLLIFITANMFAQKNIAEDSNQFCFELYSELSSETENVLFSPFSISTVMALVYAGAEKETKQEFVEVLHFNSDKDTFNNEYKSLLLKINKMNTKSIEFNVANSIWLIDDVEINKDYEKTVTESYSSKLFKANFTKKSKKTVKSINEWVSEKTNNKIEKIIDKILPNTRMLLLNAVYFNGTWESIFDEKKTSNQTFYLKKNKKISVPFMQQETMYKTYTNKLVKMIDIPYKDNKYSMQIILPATQFNIETVEKYLMENYAYWNKNLLSGYQGMTILSMPKFNFERSYSLSDVFKKMGLIKAFSQEADFSGISGDGLFISDITHKAYIDVNEKGTEAAAVTSVAMMVESIPAKFTVNEPFIFIIKNNSTNNIIFIGKVNNPNL